jgi:hypothetical protein
VNHGPTPSAAFSRLEWTEAVFRRLEEERFYAEREDGRPGD